MKKIWEDYLEEEISYLFWVKGMEKPVFREGKGGFVFRLKGDEIDSFRMIKGFCALKVLTGSCSRGRGFLVSSRRSLWRGEVQVAPLEWIGIYLDFLDDYLKEKGLRMRAFFVTEGWLFLFREIGELRLRGLDYDYYQWNSTMRVLLKWLSLPTEKEMKVYSSSLKLFYR